MFWDSGARVFGALFLKPGTTFVEVLPHAVKLAELLVAHRRQKQELRTGSIGIEEHGCR